MTISTKCHCGAVIEFDAETGLLLVREKVAPIVKPAKFDPTKPVQLRDGRKARVIVADAKGNKFPVIALVQYNPDSEQEALYSFMLDGTAATWNPSHFDLINIPEPGKVKPDLCVAVAEALHFFDAWHSSARADDDLAKVILALKNLRKVFNDQTTAKVGGN